MSACWRRIATPFVWYTLYVLQYAFSSLVWAGSSERRNLSSSYFCTSVFESWKTKFVRVVRHDNAKRLTPGRFFCLVSFSRCILPFFLDFSATSILSDERNICFFKQDEQWVDCIVMKHNRAKRRFPTSKTKVRKWFPCSVNYSLGFSKSPIPCSSTSAGASFNSLVRLAEQNKCHGPFPLVDAIMSACLVSKSSAYWPIYGLNTNCIDFARGSWNLRNNSSPSNTSNANISGTTSRTPKISSPMCSPWSCGHLHIVSFDIFNIFCFELPEGGILCIFLEPARRHKYP